MHFLADTGMLTRVDPSGEEEGIQRIGDELDALSYCSGHNNGSRNGKLHSVTPFLSQQCCTIPHTAL